MAQEEGVKKRPEGVPPVVHSARGDSSAGVKGSLRIRNIGKRQQYSASQRESYDTDIFSPKSAAFSPDGKSLYINSLEGCQTVAYAIPSLEKRYVVEYKFESGRGALWGAPEGIYTFTHYKDGADRSFGGKPVEMAWSHGGRYLWVPFYRRTFDINAQDPSAVAVVDAAQGKIIRMFETGPLPKAVAVSGDDRYVVVTHWGDNTIGFVDISGNDPAKWRTLPPLAIGKKLTLTYPLDREVNRDTKSGYLLRGTIFTPDNRYVLIAGLAGPLSVVDMTDRHLVGHIQELYGIRHLIVSNGRIYGSRNVAGEVLSFSLEDLLRGISLYVKGESKSLKVDGDIRRVKVGGGARTIEASPDGKYIFVACNSASALYVVEAERMEVADHIRCDSYPVGLAVSPDGRYIAVTSQGRKGYGGNAVNLFEVTRYDYEPPTPEPIEPDTITSAAPPIPETPAPTDDVRNVWQIMIGVFALIAITLVAVIIILHRHHRETKRS